MTVVTLRPNATISNTGALTGGATAHGVLEDDSDSSYVTLGFGQNSAVGFDDLSLPAGALLWYALLHLRLAKVSANTGVSAQLTPATAPITKSVTWLAPTTVGILIRTETSDAELDAVALDLRRSVAQDLKIYEAYLDVRYVVKPTLTVDAPTGTVSDTNTPLFSWSATLDADGGPQTDFELRVFTVAQYGIGGFDPATSPATLTFDGHGHAESEYRDPSAILADGTYRVYVRMAQTVNGSKHWSGWAFGGFILDTPLPAAPTLALEALPDQGAVELTITSVEGAATTHAFEVWRSTDGGATWVPVRTTEGDDGIVTQT